MNHVLLDCSWIIRWILNNDRNISLRKMLKSEHFQFYCFTIFAAKPQINQHSMETCFNQVWHSKIPWLLAMSADHWSRYAALREWDEKPHTNNQNFTHIIKKSISRSPRSFIGSIDFNTRHQPTDRYLSLIYQYKEGILEDILILPCLPDY